MRLCVRTQAGARTPISCSMEHIGKIVVVIGSWYLFLRNSCKNPPQVLPTVLKMKTKRKPSFNSQDGPTSCMPEGLCTWYFLILEFSSLYFSHLLSTSPCPWDLSLNVTVSEKASLIPWRKQIFFFLLVFVLMMLSCFSWKPFSLLQLTRNSR